MIDEGSGHSRRIVPQQKSLKIIKKIYAFAFLNNLVTHENDNPKPDSSFNTLIERKIPRTPSTILAIHIPSHGERIPRSASFSPPIRQAQYNIKKPIDNPTPIPIPPLRANAPSAAPSNATT